MMKIFKTTAVCMLAALCGACGSYKAVRPEIPKAKVAEARTYSVAYRSADGKRITAVYVNSNSPMTVELRQGNTVESLKQIQSWAKGVEYGNLATRWHVRDGFATLTRRNKKTVYTEIVE